MGLDAVEIFLEVEKKFNVSISDAAAEKMLTVSNMVDYIFDATRVGSQPPTKDEIYSDVCDILVKYLYVKKEDIRPNSRFVQDLGME